MLIRLARAVVQSVLSQMMQQINILEEQAMNPLRAMIEAVVGGMWRGEGANAFVEELSSIMIPGVGRISDSVQLTSSNISNAVNVIDRADEQVNGIINSRVADAFRFF
jgi:uncharacterized protein YukE